MDKIREKEERISYGVKEAWFKYPLILIGMAWAGLGLVAIFAGSENFAFFELLFLPFFEAKVSGSSTVLLVIILFLVVLFVANRQYLLEKKNDRSDALRIFFCFLVSLLLFYLASFVI